MTLTLPNLLTLLRLCAAPGFALCYLFLARPWADVAALGIFVMASATDWIDGYLARRWKQVTKLGTMLDPIADKAMVVIALFTLAYVSSLGAWLLLPGAFILFREVFVSGLREYLGDTAGLLKVTKLAKWKTTAQMVAISVLVAQGFAEHQVGMAVFGMDGQMIADIFEGRVEDRGHLRFWAWINEWVSWSGLALIWIAALLTVLTGADYFRKAQPYLKD